MLISAQTGTGEIIAILGGLTATLGGVAALAIAFRKATQEVVKTVKVVKEVVHKDHPPKGQTPQSPVRVSAARPAKKNNVGSGNSTCEMQQHPRAA